MTAQTAAGVSLAISLAAPASYDEAGYYALNPVQIGEVTNIGEFGREFATVMHQSLQRRATSKRKGSFDNGTVAPTLALDAASGGQATVEAAKDRASPAYFQIVLQDGTTYWLSGVVRAFRTSVNGADDVVMATISIDVESAPIVRIPAGWEPPRTYDPDATALFARFDIQPTTARKQLISDRFVAGKAKPFWGKLDALWVHAAHGAEAGRLNWLAPRFNCLPVNDPLFEVDRGYNGDGVMSYLDTQFNPATVTGVKFSQNSGCFGIRSNSDNAAAGSLAGFWDGTKGVTIQPRNPSNQAQFRLNQANAIVSPRTNGIGMFATNRTAANAMNGAIDGVVVASTTTQASVAPANGTLRLGGISADSLKAAQFSMGWIGAGFTDQDVADIFAWFEVYRKALGITA